MTKILKIFTILFLGLTLISCSSDKEPKIPPLPSFKATTEIKTVWTNKLSGRVSDEFLKLSPAFSGNKVFAASNTGVVEAIDDATGKILWKINLKKPITSGLAANNNFIYVGTLNGEVLAINQANGNLVWVSKVISDILATPCATNNKVIVKAENGELSTFNAQTGSLIWSHTQDEPALILRGSSSPQVSGNIVISGFADGQLIAFDLNSGAILWKQQLAIPNGNTAIERMTDIDADPIIANGIIYVVAFQGDVAALNLTNGHPIWQRELSSFAGLALSNNALYVSDAKDNIIALDRFTGKILWQQPMLKYRKITGPATNGNFVAVGDYEGYLHFFSALNGNLIARISIDKSGIVTQPIAKNNAIYVITRNGTLKKFKP